MSLEPTQQTKRQRSTHAVIPVIPTIFVFPSSILSQTLRFKSLSLTSCPPSPSYSSMGRILCEVEQSDDGIICLAVHQKSSNQTRSATEEVKRFGMKLRLKETLKRFLFSTLIHTEHLRIDPTTNLQKTHLWLRNPNRRRWTAGDNARINVRVFC